MAKLLTIVIVFAIMKLKVRQLLKTEVNLWHKTLTIAIAYAIIKM